MDTKCLTHVLTVDEIEKFSRQGYLVIPNALDDDHRMRLTDAFDSVQDKYSRLYDVQPNDRLLLLDLIGTHTEFLDLIDHFRILPKVWGILGWNLQLYHTHSCLAPPFSDESEVYEQHYVHSNNPTLSNKRGPLASTAAWQWHRDSGQVNQDLGPLPHPRLSVKVAYFLTNLTQSHYGNMYVVPGSHLDTQHRQAKPTGDIEGAIPLCVPAGSAVIFDRRIFHSSSPNHGAHSRKAIFYGYSHRWFRPRDDMSVSHLIEDLPPIQQQLLGASLGAYGYSSPSIAEVPLKAWIEEHCPSSLKYAYE